MANGNLNSRTRPHLEENLAKSLKDQSKFNRAQATKLSCRSLNKQPLTPGLCRQWLSTPLTHSFWSPYCNWHHVALLLFSRFLLTQSFYSFTALAAHACNHFTKPVYTPHGALLVFSPPQTTAGYTSHVHSPQWKATLQFSSSLSKIITITQVRNSLYQAASNQIPTSLVDRGKHLNWGWQDLGIKFYVCIGTPRAASIHSRLWTWQAVSTADFSPKHLFPQAFLFQIEGLLHETKNWLLHQRCY